MARDYIDSADCAKMIRADLKRRFPGVKFSVRTDRYAGGSSVRVSWQDGPTVREVERIAKRREGADFNGMTDCKTYRTDLVSDEDGAVREVHYGADFVFCTREFSAPFEVKAEAWLRDRLGADRLSLVADYDRPTMVRRVCHAMDAGGAVVEENFYPECWPEVARRFVPGL